MKYLTYLFIFILFVATSCKQNTPPKEKPNVIVMLIDDAGYADFGFAGSNDLKTPNIDKLAANGIVFSDAHVTATVCGPSRAGLITGRYQQRFGFECNPSENFTGINLNESTIADAMKQAGYKTAAFGKWHLGNNPEYRPNSRGFDYFWGFLAGSRSYFRNDKEDQEGENHSIRENDRFTTFDGYLTDCLAKKTVDFIENNKDDPFFIYWSPNAVHTPMEATGEDMKRFKSHPRQKLAAMTWALDRAVGNIISKLEQEDLFDNTLIFFLSDNGGAHNNQSSNYPLKGFKGNKFEGGHRVPFFVHWPAKFSKGRYNELISSLDIFATSIAVTGESVETNKPLDGVNLIPYLEEEKTGAPHELLFWRKDKMAAMRDSELKMVRVEQLGYRLYDLNKDLGEQIDLSLKEKDKLAGMKQEMNKWEEELATSLWTEGEIWDTITWMIHEDLFNNNDIRVASPLELNKYLENKNSILSNLETTFAQ